jgi:hypothetical protein
VATRHDKQELMTVGIIHALMRQALDLFAPGTGRRRGPTHPTVDIAALTTRAVHAAPSALPAHRSPYGLHTFFDGAATVMVRPYLVADEWSQEQEFARPCHSCGRTSSCPSSPPQARQFAEAS